jgi:predicted HAD superfamily phosphohydrolase YqeG
MKHVKLFEQFIKEAEGKKASVFLTKLGDNVEHETVASMQAQDEEPSSEIMAAMKKLAIGAEDCVVIGDYHTDDWNRVLKMAKSSGIKFIEVEDENGSAIVFSLTESRRVNEASGTSAGVDLLALLDDALSGSVEFQTIYDMKKEDQPPSRELNAAVKKIGGHDDNVAVIYSQMTDDWDTVLKTAREWSRSGGKYVEVEDEDGSAIVFGI